MNGFAKKRAAQARAIVLVAAMAGVASAQAETSDDAPPASNQIAYTVKPSEADPAIKRFDEPNLIVLDENVSADAPLAVFLPGTTGKPLNARRLLHVIASQGYRAIGLEYDDEPAVVQVCPRNPNTNCSANFRQQRIFGDSKNAPIDNTVEESIVHRLVMLLHHLDRAHPDQHWSQYLDGEAPVWSRIVVSGLSQGAGMAAYIAKQKPVARVVLFSSPWDFYGPLRTLAPWLAEPSVTPPERWFAEFHQREDTAALIAKAYELLKIPQDHILVFNLDPPDGGHGSNPFHDSTVRLPGYEPQWRLLYGKVSADQSRDPSTN